MARSTVAVRSADNREDVGSIPTAPTITALTKVQIDWLIEEKDRADYFEAALAVTRMLSVRRKIASQVCKWMQNGDTVPDPRLLGKLALSVSKGRLTKREARDKIRGHSSAGERLPCKQDVVGSNPSGSTTIEGP